jgi:16S rRNA (guanine527-N7)-methyltransferase
MKITPKESQLIAEKASEMGFNLSGKTINLLLQYLALLKHWASRTNLTAIRTDREIIIKHFMDSLIGLKALGERRARPSGFRVLDVGTGAGFPGLPIAICRPDLSFTLVEPRRKKAAFLHTVTGKLHLGNVVILAATLEQVAGQPLHLRAYDRVLSRALKPGKIINLALQLLRPQGRVVLWMIRPEEDEEVRKRGSNETISYRLPGEDFERKIVLLGNN